MRFAGEWRDYQARVLGEIDAHLDDDRLHVVAAPGSGKTVLGLEAMRRIGRPALVLSPSLAIRNQWAERLCPLFLPDLGPHRHLLSRDLAAPADLTLATYQALHAAHRADARFAALRALGPLTLVLDECHHLRREWWTALFALRDLLDDVVIVALTATPPYDASHAEWSRYEQLCGPIDEEIGVPELVRNGDLAPHQDHLVFSEPEAGLVASLMQRRDAVFALADEVARDADLPGILLTHPWLASPFQHEEAILAAPEQLSAMLFFLASRAVALPQEPLLLLGVDGTQVPQFNHFWLEPMLNLLLGPEVEGWRLDEVRRKGWRGTLSAAGLITSDRVDFSESVELARLLAGSTAKLPSLVQIARAESASLGEGLRMAVLTDHVRAAELPRSPAADYTPARLGVVPVFETLRRAGVGQPLGMLTGSLVAIPQGAVAAAREAAQALAIPSGDLVFAPMPGQPGYVSLDFAQAADRGRVALITRLVSSGHVRVLVGTQALLGEGWDAPSINSLVLASNAASFMLSNQMRGRAIRTDPAAPGKVANIWHLATVDPADLHGTEGADLDRLRRRFAMFDGVAEDGSPVIENGMERLDIAFETGVEQRNAVTLQRAADRAATASHWAASLGAGTERAQVREVAEVSGTMGSAQLHVRTTLRSFLLGSVGSGVVAGGMALRGVSDLAAVAAIGGGALLIYALPGLLRGAWLWLRNGTLERRLEQVGRCLLLALARTGQLSREESAYAVIVRESVSGRHAVALAGGTRADQHRFVDAMGELLGPVQNPRYVLRRQGQALGFRQLDYHAVPTLLGANKDHAELFAALWRDHVGPARLTFTRSADGRRVLLRARARSLAAGLQSPVERRSMWL
ncbi:MAG: DEAD/DEAH box helicase family protein [Erythrobacter sp.]|nr:DEAD/DEAH box helicase family protein [Erythrobacter sp.]